MFTVAFIGPDGAGKTTVCQQVKLRAHRPARYIYMGINPAASNVMLPSTWLMMRLRQALGTDRHYGGPRDHNRKKGAPKGIARRTISVAKSFCWLGNMLGEQWFRQLYAKYQVLRRRLVLFDRHYLFDYYAYDIEGKGGERRLARRVHGYLLDRLYPRPHLVILLDAPAESLYDRKHEGSVELLRQRRRDYYALRSLVSEFHVVDSTQPLEEVVDQVASIINGYGRRVCRAEWQDIEARAGRAVRTAGSERWQLPTYSSKSPVSLASEDPL